VKKVKKKRDRKYILHLTCEECGLVFDNDRYQKYCNLACRKIASARFAKIRYAEMRNIVLKARGVIK